MTDTPLVYVVIVNWNRWDDTESCIASILAADYSNLHPVVVDNGSTLGSCATLRRKWPRVEVIRSPINVGFAAGADLGIEHALKAGADYILTLNNDVLVDPQCPAQLVAAAEVSPDVGIVGPKIYYLDPPNLIWFAGANRNRWTLSLMHYGKGRPDAPEFDRPREVDYLCAGAMLIRSKVFARVGLFDPGYFMYYEDCDFCIRVRAQGYRMVYVPTAMVWHKVAASTGGEGSPLETYYRTCSVFRFVRRHANGPHRVGLMVARVGYIVLRMAYFRSLGQPELTRSLWQGLRDGLIRAAR